MEFLKIGLNQHANVEILGGPTYEEGFGGKKAPVYIVSVGGNSMRFTATDRLMASIEQFRTTSGNKLVLLKKPLPNGHTFIDVLPQGDITTQPQNSITKDITETAPKAAMVESNGKIQGLADHVASRIVAAKILKGILTNDDEIELELKRWGKFWYEYRISK